MTERITMAESLPATAVVRVSRASYDPSRFAEVDAASKKTSQYIIPAIRRLPGLLHFYAGVSPKGSIVQVSVWDTDEHAAQLDQLKEMVVDGRRDMEAVGVTFTPISTTRSTRPGPSDPETLFAGQSLLTDSCQDRFFMVPCR